MIGDEVWQPLFYPNKAGTGPGRVVSPCCISQRLWCVFFVVCPRCHQHSNQLVACGLPQLLSLSCPAPQAPFFSHLLCWFSWCLHARVCSPSRSVRTQVVTEAPLPPSLQEYIRLLQPWCHVNMGSCCFMMGRCYLVMGEGHKVRHLSPASTGGMGPPHLMGAGNISLLLCLFWANSRTGGEQCDRLLGWLLWAGAGTGSAVSLVRQAGPVPQEACTSCFLVCFQALDCFCQAASEVGREEFLDRLIQPEEGEMVSTPRLQYYNKVQLSPSGVCVEHRVIPHQHCLQRGFLLSFWERDFGLRKHGLFWGKMSMQPI